MDVLTVPRPVVAHEDDCDQAKRSIVHRSGRASCNKLEWGEDVRGFFTSMTAFVEAHAVDFQLGPGEHPFATLRSRMQFQDFKRPDDRRACDTIRGNRVNCELREGLSETLRRLKQIY